MTSPAVLFSGEWLSMAETAETLGKAPKTIEAMVTNQQINSKLIPRAGRKPERVYEARDVQRLLDEAAERAKRVRPRSEAVALAPKITALAIPPQTVEIARELVAQFLAPRPLALTEKLWLSLDEASEYSGLARGDLKRLCANGALVARKSGGWRIRRASLEAF